MGEDVTTTIARIEERLKSVQQKIDEAIITQLQDHGMRLRMLEQRQQWILAYITIAGAIGAFIGKYLVL